MFSSKSAHLDIVLFSLQSRLVPNSERFLINTEFVNLYSRCIRFWQLRREGEFVAQDAFHFCVCVCGGGELFEKSVQNLVRNLKGRGHLEDVDVGGRIILK